MAVTVTEVRLSLDSPPSVTQHREVEPCEAFCLAPWPWLRLTLPPYPAGAGREEEVQLYNYIVQSLETNGFEYGGKCFLLASTSKGESKHGATAWMVSPPDGEITTLERALGYREHLAETLWTTSRPFPLFMLRARVKQLFTPSVAIDRRLQLHIVEDTRDDTGRLRDDGGGLIDPVVLKEAAEELHGRQLAKEGLRRFIYWSAQIRWYGLKGMLASSEALRGTAMIKAPYSMQKFSGHGAAQLRIISFSAIRPKPLSRDVVLRLEAAGVPGDLLVEAQERHLRRLTSPPTKRTAFMLLPGDSEGHSDEPGAQTAHYFRQFAGLVTCGFALDGQPLATVLRRQRQSEIKAAQHNLHLDDVWSMRGHPAQPGLELGPGQVVAVVPETGGGWRPLLGRVIIGREQDLDVADLWSAEAIDPATLPLPEGGTDLLRGLLWFPTTGPPPPAKFDFDGDYYFVIANKSVVEKVNMAAVANLPTPAPAATRDPTPSPERIPSLTEVQGCFLREMPCRDRIGLLHHRWETEAGNGPDKAASESVRRVAAAHAIALDVEKGGQSPPELPRPRHYVPVWDFMQKKDQVGEQQKSPTAMGRIFRKAKEALEMLELELKKETSCLQPGLVPDRHLEQAWHEVLERLGNGAAAKLKSQAAAYEKTFKQMMHDVAVREEEGRYDRGASATRPGGDSLRRKREWLLLQRKGAAEAIAPATLPDLALAAWAAKYLRDGLGMAFKPEETTPSWPWLFLGRELLEVKRTKSSCNQCNHEVYRKALLALKDACSSEHDDNDDNDAQDTLREAVRCCLQEGSVSCPSCRDALLREHAELHSLCLACESQSQGLPQHSGGVAAGLRSSLAAVARGVRERVSCNSLRYCKKEIESVFRNAKQGQEPGPVQDMIDRLVEGELQPDSLRLEAVRFHGHLMVVEGNRRLYALQTAAQRLQRPLEVDVNIQDLYLGRIRGLPALRLFHDKWTTTNGGCSVDVVHPQLQPQPQPQSHPPQPSMPAPTPTATPTPASGSASSPPPAPTLNTAGGVNVHDKHDQVIAFGKFRGRKYYEVWADERKARGYVDWVLQEFGKQGDSCQDDFAQLAQYFQAMKHNAQTQPPHRTASAVPVETGRQAMPTTTTQPVPKGSDRLGFTKDPDRTLSEALRDIGLCKWALSKEGDGMPNLQRFVDYIRSERPGLLHQQR